jgi:hypothetical protein
LVFLGVWPVLRASTWAEMGRLFLARKGVRQIF